MIVGPFDARFDAAFAECPLVAILRGIRPENAEAIGQVLFDTGFRLIEVPLNSPDPFDSIARLLKRLGSQALIGAGTVTTVEEVRELARIGASLSVSPHADTDVILKARKAGLVSIPGILSPTEAFAAIRAGANALKLFPMEMIGSAGVKALRAVLPRDLRLIAVGGIDATNMAALRSAGCSGFGLGSSLFKPTSDAGTVLDNAKALLSAIRS